MTGRPSSFRVAVGVSGGGTILQALAERVRRGALSAEVCLVFGDRPCPAIEWAVRAALPTAVVPLVGGRAEWDRRLAAALGEVSPDIIALAGFMRLVGPAVLDGFRGRILNTHPSLLPAFPGAHPVRDALAHGATVTGATVHLVDERLDGGPIVLQEAVPVSADDDEAMLHERIKAVERRLLPRAIALLAAGAVRVEGRRVRLDPIRAAETLPAPRRALLSVSDKRGLSALGRALADLGFELVSSGGTAGALRAAGLTVTDVASLTGSPEMLDGRVKTLHPRIHAGILADLRRADHRSQLAAAGIEPFELVVVNLYPFEAAAERAGTTLDELVEEIDVGGPALIRAAAKNHANVAVVTRPDQYDGVLAELWENGTLREETRRALAVEAFRLTGDYDALIDEALARRFSGPGSSEMDGVFPSRRRLELTLAERLRYGENPHQRAALYRLATSDPGGGPFAAGIRQIQGKPLSYNNILDAAAAAGLARDLRGPAVVIVKHTNPCGAAERKRLPAAWEAALAGDPVSAFGGVIAITRPIDARLAERLTSMFLEVVIAPSFSPAALRVLAGRENLRVLQDELIDRPAAPSIEYRSAGGAILATEADVAPDDPTGWQVVTARAPTAEEIADLDFAWRLARHVKSNAIVLARDRAIVGVGAGQMSRVDAARIAVQKAGERAAGGACASDAFFPFPDALEVCLAAGVRAFIQPGGSIRDAEVIGAADAGGSAMLFTGIRHFRH